MKRAVIKDIFLTGPKHSGKTSVGKALASLCKREFIDLDELIEKQTGKSPRALYRESPEIFGKAEAEAVRTLFVDAAAPNAAAGRIIAAGGGLIDNPDALGPLQNRGVILIYLDVSANTAWDRINAGSGGELPPFLQTENPRETHRTLHERRAAACRGLANLIINAEGKSPPDIAKEILSCLVL